MVLKRRHIISQKGFTLLEVLLVVAIIAILAGIVIIAINPGKQLGDSRNAQRSADVTTILNAVYQYALDNNGAMPAANIPTAPTVALEICATGGVCTGLVDLAPLTTNEKYLTTIPKDPQCTSCGANGDGYKIQKSANNRVTISSTYAEQGKTITVTR
jgi:prepilin-type N-terminal cleavage/methylation domain-containing protein